MHDHSSKQSLPAAPGSRQTRRTFLQRTAAILPLPTVLAAWSARKPKLQTLAPTPECEDDDDVTPPQTEGPFFTPRSPERRSLLSTNLPGTRLVVTGFVFTTECTPVANALLDFWQADDAGAYDNDAYRLRGHQFTDAEGRFRLETIVPGLYPGRTRHLHVKVQAPGQRILTTQLYFPGEQRNARDRIFNPSLVMQVADTAAGKRAVFDFILNMK